MLLHVVIGMAVMHEAYHRYSFIVKRVAFGDVVNKFERHFGVIRCYDRGVIAFV